MLIATNAIFVDAGPEAVWPVLTEPERMRAWLSDADLVVDGPLVPGGPYRMHGDWHGQALVHEGLVLAMEPARLFRYSFASNVWRQPEAVVTCELAAEGQGTRLAVTQEHVQSEAALGHVNFYWRMALGAIKGLAERR